MLKKFKLKTQAISATIMTGALIGFSGSASATGNTGVGGQTLDDYFRSTSTNVNQIPDAVAFLSYLGGTILAALGVIGLKQHVEDPNSNPMKNALAKLGFGGLLLAVPTVTGVMFETTEGAGQAANIGFDDPNFNN